MVGPERLRAEIVRDGAEVDVVHAHGDPGRDALLAAAARPDGVGVHARVAHLLRVDAPEVVRSGRAVHLHAGESLPDRLPRLRVVARALAAHAHEEVRHLPAVQHRVEVLLARLGGGLLHAAGEVGALEVAVVVLVDHKPRLGRHRARRQRRARGGEGRAGGQNGGKRNDGVFHAVILHDFGVRRIPNLFQPKMMFARIAGICYTCNRWQRGRCF